MKAMDVWTVNEDHKFFGDFEWWIDCLAWRLVIPSKGNPWRKK